MTRSSLFAFLASAMLPLRASALADLPTSPSAPEVAQPVAPTAPTPPHTAPAPGAASPGHHGAHAPTPSAPPPSPSPSPAQPSVATPGERKDVAPASAAHPAAPTPARASKPTARPAGDRDPSPAAPEPVVGKARKSESSASRASKLARTAENADADRESAGRGAPRPAASLSMDALRWELRQPAAAGSNDRAPQSDRARLEQLAGEIAQAREALRQETARLEELLKRRPSEEPSEGESAPAPRVTPPPAPASESEGQQLLVVSKAMKGMKPEQAAAVVARLDTRLAAEILRRMRAQDAGAVMGFLKPDQAAELATEIATRKPLAATPRKGGER